MDNRPLTPPSDRRVWSERLVRISGFRRFLPTRGSQRIFPFVVLFATLLITAALAAALGLVIDGWEEESFGKRGDAVRGTIKHRMDAAIGLLRAASTLNPDRTYRDAVRSFIVEQSLSEFPGIQSIGYCERVTAKEKPEVLAWLNHEFPAQPVSFRPEIPVRAEWYPIVAVEPLEPNRWTLGWDLFHEEARRSAMERARDTDRPAATKRVKTPTDPSLQRSEPGFYVFMPVYREGAPAASPAERKDALQGFTFCLFRIHSLLRGVIPEETPPFMALRVYDGAEAGRAEDLIYEEHEDPDYTPSIQVHPLEVYGATWTLEFVTQPGIHQTKPRVLIPWIAIGGVVCSLLLFLATFALVHARMDAERIEGILREKSMELARSNTDLERFAYVASHDLREPLRMVTSYVQLLEKRYADKLDVDAREFIRFAVDGATRMNEFLDGLLHLSRVARDPGVHDPSDSNRVLKTALVNLKPAIADSSAQVTTDSLPSARINETHLLQLFQNLVGNAVKFQKNGAPRIHVSAVRDGELVRFSVRDNGIGIDAAFADQVFEVFRRLHTRDHYPGSGIGLAICKRIVEQRGGKIWFDSVPDQGTTFYFTLPAGELLAGSARPKPVRHKP